MLIVYERLSCLEFNCWWIQMSRHSCRDSVVLSSVVAVPAMHTIWQQQGSNSLVH